MLQPLPTNENMKVQTAVFRNDEGNLKTFSDHSSFDKIVKNMDNIKKQAQNSQSNRVTGHTGASISTQPAIGAGLHSCHYSRTSNN
jgi:galactokinase